MDFSGNGSFTDQLDRITDRNSRNNLHGFRKKSSPEPLAQP